MPLLPLLDNGSLYYILYGPQRPRGHLRTKDDTFPKSSRLVGHLLHFLCFSSFIPLSPLTLFLFNIKPLSPSQLNALMMILKQPSSFPSPLFLFLFLITSSVSSSLSPTAAPTSSPLPPSSSSTLDPKQLRALQSLNIPTSRDPCSPSSLHNVTLCDSSAPFRHLLSLRLANCSDDVALSFTALKSLSTLQSFQFLNCPISPIRFPSDLATSLRSFTCIRSLRKLTGVWLSRLRNLTDLTVSHVSITASGPYVILGNMKSLRSLTISHANLTGFVPKHLNRNLTHVDFSGNKLRGKIPTSITLLENLETLDLSLNWLKGEIPTSIGDLISLQNLSLASNSLSGSIPESFSAIPGLVHIDLGSNQLNGTIPRFISEMRSLKFLNLENNEFHGVIPFNESFIKGLEVFKIQGNNNLCYNHSILSSKLKLGIAPCDKHGLPISPPTAKDDGDDSMADDSGSDYDGNDENDVSHKEANHHHGPNKVVLGVAIGLSSLVFLIVFSILLSKCCR